MSKLGASLISPRIQAYPPLDMAANTVNVLQTLTKAKPWKAYENIENSSALDTISLFKGWI